MGYALSDAEWRLIEPISAVQAARRSTSCDRHMLNGIFWVLSEGLYNKGVADILCVMVGVSEI